MDTVTVELIKMLATLAGIWLAGHAAMRAAEKHNWRGV